MAPSLVGRPPVAASPTMRKTMVAGARETWRVHETWSHARPVAECFSGSQVRWGITMTGLSAATFCSAKYTSYCGLVSSLTSHITHSWALHSLLMKYTHHYSIRIAFSLLIVLVQGRNIALCDGSQLEECLWYRWHCIGHNSLWNVMSVYREISEQPKNRWHFHLCILSWT